VSGQTGNTHFVMGPLAYVRGMGGGGSFGSQLRGRLWSNDFGWQSLFGVGHAHLGSIGRRADLPTSL
jgi:hypothetical protein